MALERNASYLIPNTEDWISYAVRDTGFHFQLDRRVPGTMEPLAPVLRDLATDHGWDIGNLDFYIIHAGGPRILDDLSKFLDVDPAMFRHSWATLTEYGNIASAVVLEALRRLFDEDSHAPGRHRRDRGLRPRHHRRDGGRQPAPSTCRAWHRGMRRRLPSGATSRPRQGGESHERPGRPTRSGSEADHQGAGGHLQGHRGATASFASIFEVVVPPGFDVGAHTHHHSKEFFYVLEGELDLFAFEPVERTGDRWQDWESADGDRAVRAGAGSCMFVPTGCPHAFTNPTDKPTRMLFQSYPPPDHERYFEEICEIFSAGRTGRLGRRAAAARPLRRHPAHAASLRRTLFFRIRTHPRR